MTSRSASISTPPDAAGPPGPLLIGLSGGIASGKSTVARRLVELGAVLIDADALAREVVGPGSPGLSAVVSTFGSEVVRDDALDREALGRMVFSDPDARRRLESIVHPLIAARTRELIDEQPSESIVVHDIPLLVELQRDADYHLTVIVLVDAERRIERLVRDRGMSESDARARVDAQATDQQRRAAADVLLPNESSLDALIEAVDDLWTSRIVPFAAALLSGEAALRVPPWLTPVTERLAHDADRLGRRVVRSLEAEVGAARRTGPAAIGTDPAPDVAEVVAQVPVVTAELVESLRRSGYPPVEPIRPWGFAAGTCDPGRAARVHIRGPVAPELGDAFEQLLRQPPGDRSPLRDLSPGADFVLESVPELTRSLIGPYLARTPTATVGQVTTESVEQVVRFDRIDMVVALLHAYPQIVPGFTVQGYRESLWRLHCRLEADGPLVTTARWERRVQPAL